ncbi:hypothetical protein AB0873_09545 [Micromonospora sp. NPDC047707]|uniref:hypothetical protein n=1 Tax=Micromonospora sp. NPDC047707 TaxID=3154498 RepID=UPI003454FC69
MNLDDQFAEMAQLAHAARQVLAAAQRPDLDQLIGPILDQMEAIVARRGGERELEHVLEDLRFAWTVITGGAIT